MELKPHDRVAAYVYESDSVEIVTLSHHNDNGLWVTTHGDIPESDLRPMMHHSRLRDYAREN